MVGSEVSIYCIVSKDRLLLQEKDWEEKMLVPNVYGAGVIARDHHTHFICTREPVMNRSKRHTKTAMFDHAAETSSIRDGRR